MTQRCRPLNLIMHAVVVGLLVNPMAASWAGNDFGGDWQPKPLVDTSMTSPTSAPKADLTASKPPVPAQPELEAKLKPAEPFIRDVETRLSITSKPGTSLVTRLDSLQTVLFGEPKYQDAGELLGKLAEIFPKEAAKAQAGLMQQRRSSQPSPAGNASQLPAHANPVKPAVYPPVGSNQQPYAAPPSQYAPGMANVPQPSAPKPAKKKHFWQDDWESDFENDPFFNDKLNQSSQRQSQQAPSKLSSVGQGLAGLAMMAGGVAGNYYLNKKLGNTATNPQYYNDPYYNGYGYPYGTNPYGYGSYAVPYGYGTYAVPYGSGYPPPPAGAYSSPYGGVITTQPYQRYGTSSFGGVSPLGVPTGF